MSKAKLGCYNEYLGLYIRFWDRGYDESEWSDRERKYTIVRDASQKEDDREIQVHGHERNESEEDECEIQVHSCERNKSGER